MTTVVAGAEGDAADQLSSCLQAGGIAIAPCDTIYGILGSVPATRSKIKKVKGREEGKPFIDPNGTPRTMTKQLKDALKAQNGNAK